MTEVTAVLCTVYSVPSCVCGHSNTHIQLPVHFQFLPRGLLIALCLTCLCSDCCVCPYGFIPCRFGYSRPIEQTTVAPHPRYRLTSLPHYGAWSVLAQASKTLPEDLFVQFSNYTRKHMSSRSRSCNLTGTVRRRESPIALSHFMSHLINSTLFTEAGHPRTLPPLCPVLAQKVGPGLGWPFFAGLPPSKKRLLEVKTWKREGHTLTVNIAGAGGAAKDMKRSNIYLETERQQ
ncbi:hypothetical protein J6590_054125 [Homalodisca vitripennis]|nr:hypothetical protein J6590_054125 [Homalodisca vitripennis]